MTDWRDFFCTSVKIKACAIKKVKIIHTLIFQMFCIQRNLHTHYGQSFVSNFFGYQELMLCLEVITLCNKSEGKSLLGCGVRIIRQWWLKEASCQISNMQLKNVAQFHDETKVSLIGRQSVYINCIKQNNPMQDSNMLGYPEGHWLWD